MTRSMHHRSLARVALGFAAAVLSLVPARAGSGFTGLTDFGDSYADTGAPPGGGIRLLLGNPTCPPAVAIYPTCRYTGGTNFVDSLQQIYGLSGVTNYAIGGALSNDHNTFSPTALGFTQELAAFAASGTHFAPTDLVVLSIGANDTTLIASTDTLAQAQAVGATSADNTAAGIRQLAAAGAHTIALVRPGHGSLLPAPPAGADGLPLSPDQRTAFGDAYFQEVQTQLVPLARQGVRIFIFDFQTLQARVAANPQQYGFQSAGGCQATLGVQACLAAPASVQNSYFYFNETHPGSAAMDLIATYMANQMDAPTTVAPQGAILTGIASDFADSTLGRLEAYRGIDAPRRAPLGSSGAWSVYLEDSYSHGSFDGEAFAAGYHYDAPGITAGIEYRPDASMVLGGVFNYSRPRADLDAQGAEDRIDTYQFAGYASFTDANVFADLVAGYGHHDLSLARAGVIDVISAGTNAQTFTIDGRAGYLFDLGPLRAGPLVGLRYAHASVDGYTENGDSLLTMMVDGQTVNRVSGDAGLTFRSAFPLDRLVLNPYVDLTAERDFTGYGRFVVTTPVSTPLLPVLTEAPDGRGTYGRVSAGVAAAFSDRISATANFTSTFGRRGGDDFTVGGGLKLSL